MLICDMKFFLGAQVLNFSPSEPSDLLRPPQLVPHDLLQQAVAPKNHYALGAAAAAAHQVVRE
jgi:hypothetical protein